MQKIQPIPAIEQPLLWRQSISQSKFGKIDWSNFFYYPLTKWAFIYKKHESFLVDHLIYGSNPILAFLSFLKLYSEANRLYQKGELKAPVHIGILLSDNIDYWGYHLFDKKDTWSLLNEKCQFTFGFSFKEFLERQKEIFVNHECIKLTFIKQDNISVSYYNKDEQYTEGYIIHLQSKTKSINKYQEAMPNILLSIDNIRNKYIEDFYQFLSKEGNKNSNIQCLEYSENFKNTKEVNNKTHILLAKNIILTSLPSWVNATSYTKELQFEQNSYQVTAFQHAFDSQCVGSSKHTPNDFLSMEKQSIDDFIALFKNGFKY